MATAKKPAAKKKAPAKKAAAKKPAAKKKVAESIEFDNATVHSAPKPGNCNTCFFGETKQTRQKPGAQS